MYRIKILLAILLASGVFSSAWALQSDRNQAIDIKADRVEVDQRTQTSQYFGNVRMVQGSMKIDADHVVVYMHKGKLDKILITGTPAHFQQQAENHQSLVTSTANEMEYYAAKQRLLLKHDAQVNQGANHFRGDFIEYDTLSSTVKANKGANSNSRVHAIIQPGNTTDKQQDTPPPDQAAQPPKANTP